MKINVNLLPPELSHAVKEQAKKTLVVRFSVVFLLVMIAITSVLISVVLAQNLNLNNIEEKITASKNQLNSFKEHEGILTILKTRIDSINNLYSAPSPQADAYNLITSLMPGGISVNTFAINKQNNLLLGGETSSTRVLEEFFINLTDPKEHLGQINSVKLDSLSRSQNGNLRFDLTISLSGVKLTQNNE